MWKRGGKVQREKVEGRRNEMIELEMRVFTSA